MGIVLVLKSVLPVSAAEEQIFVSAVVGAKQENFTISLERLSPINNVITPGNKVVYRLYYEHDLTFAVKIKLKAYWDTTTPIISYVVGSATNAYGNASPVIDTNSGSITWETSMIPPDAGKQYVDFTLVANSFVTNLPTNVEINAQLTEPVNSEIVKDLLIYYYRLPTPPASPSPTPTLSPSPSPGVQEPPEPSPSPFPGGIVGAITKVEIISLNDSSAKIRATLSSQRLVKIIYRPENGQELETIANNFTDQKPIFELSDLRPKTKYYYYFVDAQTGERLTKETFQFITPELGGHAVPGLFSFHVLFKEELVTHWQSDSLDNIKWLVQDLPYTLIVRFDQKQTPITESWVEIWYDQLEAPVIISSYQERLDQLQSELILPVDLVSADVYVYYKLPNGSLLSQSLGKIGIAKPLQIIDQDSNIPLEHVRVEVFAYDESTKTYKKLELPLLFIRSRWDGIVPLTLPTGKYKFEINLPGYQPQTLELSWPLDQTDVPINMKHSGNIFLHIWGQLKGFKGNFEIVFNEDLIPLFKNRQVFNSAVYLTGLLIAVATLLIAAFKTRLPLHLLPEMLRVLLSRRPASNQERILVRDKNRQKPLSDVEVTIVDPDDHEPEQRALTNRNGIVTVQTAHPAVEIFVSKPGYETISSIIVFDSDQEVIDLVAIDDNSLDSKSVLRAAGIFFKAGFELILLTCLLFQILIVINFGWIGLPLFLITLFTNLIWWIYHFAGFPRIRI